MTPLPASCREGFRALGRGFAEPDIPSICWRVHHPLHTSSLRRIFIVPLYRSTHTAGRQHVTRSHLIAVNPEDPRPLYVQIVDEVRRGILGGNLHPDSPLPSVRELARDLRVNPNTVQQAYRELEREGEIYVRRGQGSFVAPGAGARKKELRQRVAGELAETCLREAARAGLEPEELVEAIRAAMSAAVRTAAAARAEVPASSTSAAFSRPTTADSQLPDHEGSQ
ncbi:hypothetical protein BH23GEM11_BH23GEM11_16430 [soil metagenome]